MSGARNSENSSRSEPLRVLAVTAPQFVAGEVGWMVLSSGEAVSLQNACRYAAFPSETNDPSWSESMPDASRFSFCTTWSTPPRGSKPKTAEFPEPFCFNDLRRLSTHLLFSLIE